MSSISILAFVHRRKGTRRLESPGDGNVPSTKFATSSQIFQFSFLVGKSQPQICYLKNIAWNIFLAFPRGKSFGRENYPPVNFGERKRLSSGITFLISMNTTAENTSKRSIPRKLQFRFFVSIHNAQSCVLTKNINMGVLKWHF